MEVMLYALVGSLAKKAKLLNMDGKMLSWSIRYS